jgi:hypothetical protein
MIMVADLIPGLKRFLRPLPVSMAAQDMVMRLVVTFLLHAGRMSCLQAAGAIRTQPRHRAQVGRLLKRPGFRCRSAADVLRKDLLLRESKLGQFIFVIDATLCTQAGKKTENTYSTGNRQRRPQKGRRFGKQKHARKSCHSFTMGLLITPSGIRIPFSRPHYTKEYCQKKKLQHRTTAESAADLIRQLPLPEGAEVVILGDTAYDADVVREACADRQYKWIFPCNPERVLAGSKPRPKVRSLLKDWSSWSLTTIRFSPGQGPYVDYRRLSPHRIGPKAKRRTFYVHQEKRDVRAVGEVRLIFSTTKAKLTKATPDDVKILMTNISRLSLQEVVELYSLRWQIELFFKELKSTLGFHQYRFRQFACVEGWVETALLSFLYLEWYRAEQLARRKITPEEHKWWRHQRTHGLCQAIRYASQEAELKYLSERLETPGGIAKLKRLLRNGFAPEYRSKT